MKKGSLVLVLVGCIAFPVHAQIFVDWEATGGMFYDFENDVSSWFHFPNQGEVFAIDANPLKAALNPSDSVGYFLTSDALTWEGCATNIKFKAIDFVTYPIIKVKVLPPAPNMIFMVKVEDFEDHTNHPIEVEATTTVGGEWEELSFDFSHAPQTGVAYERVVLFPDFRGTTVAEWFFDDVRLDGVPITSVKGGQALPASYPLVSNFPNPFNPSTQIQYTLPHAAEVTLAVFDASGRRITTLVFASQKAGVYTVPFDGSDLASGLYLICLEAGGISVHWKMMLLK